MENVSKQSLTENIKYLSFFVMRAFLLSIFCFLVLTSTKSYTVDDLKKILVESRISPLRNLEKTVQMFGYNNLKYNEDLLNKICEEAYKLDTGARGLQSIMSGIQNTMLLGLILKQYDLENPIELSKELLNSYKQNSIRKY